MMSAMLLAAFVQVAPTLPPAPPVVVAPPAVRPTVPLDPARVAKAREVVELMVPPEQREKMFETVINGMMSNMLSGMVQGDPRVREAFDTVPEVKPVFAAFVERQRQLAMDDLRSTMPELSEAYVSAYARAFTIDDLENMRVFFSSPTGARYIQLAPTLISDPDFAAWQRHVGALASSRRDEEMRRLMEDIMPIVRAHQEKPRGS